jgi:hypothetical protein
VGEGAVALGTPTAYVPNAASTSNAFSVALGPQECSVSKMQLTSKSFLSTADKPLTFSVLGIFALLPLTFLLASAIQGPVSWGVVVTWLFFSVFFLIFMMVFFMDSSELLLDENGLARKISGRVCMQIPWTGIRSIRETFQLTRRGERRIWIHVIPKKRLGLALRLRRAIVTSDQIERFDELVAIVNERVAQYSIPVRVRTNGIWKQRPRLLATWE